MLRVLLDDDQHAFEQALVERLVQHRKSAGADPAPRSPLPEGAIALAALASLVHGWQLGVRSAYLPNRCCAPQQRPVPPPQARRPGLRRVQVRGRS
ncbi:Imm49 family immunity protein [Streptomyces hygroscopicus]|uniref:Imm49 family immunity protein n=1 Tax=Streptomyces hygroscopicus TaxID=1912 RepID=UPI003A0FE7ED